jgi:hypothetical protein
MLHVFIGEILANMTQVSDVAPGPLVRILAKKESVRQTLTMTSHTVNMFTNQNVLSLRHERIYDYHNVEFLQICKDTQTTR